LAIDRIRNGLAELDIAEPPQLYRIDPGLSVLVLAGIAIKGEIGRGQTRSQIIDRIVTLFLVLFDLFDRGRLDKLVHVDLAILHLERPCIVVRHYHERHPVYVREPLTLLIDLPIIWISLQNDPLIRGERDESIWTQTYYVLWIGTERQ